LVSSLRVLLISDVHGNLEALEACLEASPPFDVAVNLGDVVGYGASPNETVERVREVCRFHVRGNHDRACSGVSGVEGFNPVAAMAANWTHSSLTPENLEWLRSLPHGPISVDGLADVQFVHGSPLDEDEYLIGVADALEPLLGFPVPLTFFGHSHLQGGFSLYRDRGSELHPQIDHGDVCDSSELRLNQRARYLINPGSVGQPRDGDWRAGFAWLDSDARAIQFFRVPYDVEGAKRRILEAQLPERLAMRLSIGR
jgi:diadenosine tetraphosphatase ApaH/serine/threonine PP2A family protein phosphatase